MWTYKKIIGSVSEPSLAEKLHQLEHHGMVHYVTLSADDILRRRLRVQTDSGQECGIALERSDHLFDGAILHLDEDAAVVVRTSRSHWLTLQARDVAAALELGYFAGNMHWAVTFDGTVLRIAIKGRVEDYQLRLQPMLADGRVTILSGAGQDEH